MLLPLRVLVFLKIQGHQYLSKDVFIVLLAGSNLMCSAHISQHRSDVNGVCGVCAKKISYADILQAECHIVGLGVDPYFESAKVIFQRVLCLTTPTQHLCHRVKLLAHLAGKARFRFREWWNEPSNRSSCSTATKRTPLFLSGPWCGAARPNQLDARPAKR